jgi:hypothetical protein
VRYEWAETLSVESESIETITKHLGIVVDVRGNPLFQKEDVDFLWNGLRLELKVDRYYRTGNFFFETKCGDRPGCFLSTQAEFIIYYFPEGKTLYWLPMPQTREWVLANKERFIEKSLESGNLYNGPSYKATGYLVKRNEILDNVPNSKVEQLDELLAPTRWPQKSTEVT